MNIIQRLINETKSLKAKAKAATTVASNCGLHNNAAYNSGRSSAFADILSFAELLLNEQPEAITDGAHLRKHGVGRSAASDDTSNVKTDDSAPSSETPVVGQNEQTKEHFFCFKADAGDEYYCDEQCYSCANPL